MSLILRVQEICPGVLDHEVFQCETVEKQPALR